MNISHSRPACDEEEVLSVSRVIRSGHLVQGETVSQFEQEMARYIGVKSGVATSSGTAALHLALSALGIGEGDEVLLPSYVCASLLHAVRYTGATARFVEIHPHSFNLDVADAEKKVSRRSRVIIVPHLFGLPADLDDLSRLSLPIIEDCAQALGATYRGKQVGSFGLLSILSFHASKVIATGEGGMLLSSSPGIAEKVRSLLEYDRQEKYHPAFNYKMTDLQAALGLVQLKKLPLFLARRQEIARRYSEECADLPIVLPACPQDRTHIFYRYVVRVKADLEDLLRLFQREGVSAERPVFRPLHFYVGGKDLPSTEEVFTSSLSLPLYPSLSPVETDAVVTVTKRIFGGR